MCKLTDLSTDRIAGIKVNTAGRPTCFLSVYLPTRAGCTDDFKEQLDYIDACLGRLSLDNNVIIMGDLDADPGSEGGPLATTTVNEQGRILLRYLKRWEYVSVHLHDASVSSSGQTSHTYCSEAHSSLSTIDHILAPKHLLSRFFSSRVEEDDPLNLSDHQPLFSNFRCNVKQLDTAANHGFDDDSRHPITKDEIRDKYTMHVEAQLSSVSVPDLKELVCHPELINKHLELIARILQSSATANIPIKKFHKHLKPGWTHDLSSAHNKSKKAYRNWIRTGRPRSCDHPIRKEYKDAKARFRAKLRAFQREQRDKFFCDLDMNCQNTSKLFRMIRKHNGITTEPTSTLNYKGTHSGESLSEAWADYFGDLASPTNNEASDPIFQQRIEELYAKLVEDTSTDSEAVTFSHEEVAEVIHSLKANKAAGADGIDPEHLIYGGDSLVVHLMVLFNAMISAAHIPEAFQLGLVIPIPKGHNKHLSVPNNYRGITILSNISKVLEKLLMLKILQQNSPPTLNALQGGFREHMSCAHTAFILQEAIQSLRDQGKKAYVAYLDVRKAFDTVWHEGLLVKMHQKGIQGPIWHIINKWYTTCTSSLLWNGKQSKQFPIQQGVRQGGVLSPFLYCIFVDELLDILSESGIGVTINGLYCGAPMYADDLALVASSPEELQKMLDIVSNYASRWKYSLNADKSVVMVLGANSTLYFCSPHRGEMHLWKECVLRTELSWLQIWIPPPHNLI